jgi:hypothetical protein
VVGGTIMKNRLLDGYEGKKVTFLIVDSSPDVKVQFVYKHGDYKVELEDKNSFSCGSIKIQIVNCFPDVRLERVLKYPDFKVCLK